MATLGRRPYNAPNVPAKYDSSFFGTQFQLLQQAFPPITVVAVAANYTALVSDSVILGNGTFTVTLPDAASVQWAVFTIKNVGSGTITVGATVDGSASPTLAANKAMTVVSDGTSWWKIAAV